MTKVVHTDELCSVVQANDAWIASKELQADFTVLGGFGDCPLLVTIDEFLAYCNNRVRTHAYSITE